MSNEKTIINEEEIMYVGVWNPAHLANRLRGEYDVQLIESQLSAWSYDTINLNLKNVLSTITAVTAERDKLKQAVKQLKDDVDIYSSILKGIRSALLTPEKEDVLIHAKMIVDERDRYKEASFNPAIIKGIIEVFESIKSEGHTIESVDDIKDYLQSKLSLTYEALKDK